MRRSEIAEQNRYLLERQRQFRVAADVVTDACRSERRTSKSDQ